MKRIVGWLLSVCLVVSCVAACSDPDHGPPLGDFPAIAKTTADPPFDITAPSSRSPAAFSFTSSDERVATIAGARVTIVGAGVTTITASQPAIGSYGPTSGSTTLTVTRSDCPSGSILVNGVCTAKASCIAPASAENNQCVYAPTNAILVHANGFAWMGVSFALTWDKARDFCAGTRINGEAGWKQPDSAQLRALYEAHAMDGYNWTLDNTWSSTAGAGTARHAAVNLASGAVADRADTQPAYVSCVR